MGIDDEGIGRDDLGLIERAVSGDPEARECLALKARARILHWCTSLVHNHDAAEDATQDALMRMWLHLSGVSDPATFWAWLYSVTLNVVRARSHEPGWNALDFEPASPEALDAVEGARTELLGMVQNLSESERELLNLRYGLGLSGKEIALKAGVAPGTARVRLHRALKRLRGLMKRADENAGNKSGPERISGDGHDG